MPSDLRSLFERIAAEPTGGVDANDLWRRGRRRLWLARAATTTGLTLVVAAGYTGSTGVISDWFEKEGRRDHPAVQGAATGAERAAVFAIRALGQAGLRQQNRTYVNYREATEGGPGQWVAHFGPPSDCSHDVVTLGEGDRAERVDETLIDGWHCEDLSEQTVEVGVELTDDRYVVSSVTGPVNDEERASIQAYTESDEPEEPRWEVTDLEITEDSDSRIVHGVALWTGEGRDGIFQECSLVLRDESGAEVGRSDFDSTFSLNSLHHGPSDRRWEQDEVKNGGLPADSMRDGHFHEFSTQDAAEATAATIECHPMDIEKDKEKQAEEESREDAKRAETCAQSGFTCIPIEDHPFQVAVGEGAVWVGGFDVTRIDPATNEVAAVIDTGGHVEALTVGEGGVWAVIQTENSEKAFVLRIDPISNEVVGDRIEVKTNFVGDPLYGGSVGSLYAAAGEGAVWVTAPGAFLQRIDPATTDVETFSLAPQVKSGEDYGAPAVVTGDGWVWVQQWDELFRVDPESAEITGEAIDVGLNVRDMAIGAGRVWLAQQTPTGENVATWVDTATGEVGDPIEFGNAVPERVAAAPEGVWTLAHTFDDRMNSALLFTIDPASNAVVGDPIEIAASSSFSPIAVGEDSVWVAGQEVVYRVTR